MRAWRLASATLTTAALLLAGCIAPEDISADGADAYEVAGAAGVDCPGHGLTPTSAGASQSGVSNNPGAFSYGGRGLAKTGTEVHLWQNPSTGAWVQWGSQSATGSLTLRILDACGNEVYAQEQAGMQQRGGQEATARGMPGEWAIKIEFATYTGQFGLQVTSG